MLMSHLLFAVLDFIGTLNVDIIGQNDYNIR